MKTKLIILSLLSIVILSSCQTREQRLSEQKNKLMYQVETCISNDILGLYQITFSSDVIDTLYVFTKDKYSAEKYTDEVLEQNGLTGLIYVVKQVSITTYNADK